jgi:hypothetical protein
MTIDAPTAILTRPSLGWVCVGIDYARRHGPVTVRQLYWDFDTSQFDEAPPLLALSSGSV